MLAKNRFFFILFNTIICFLTRLIMQLSITNYPKYIVFEHKTTCLTKEELFNLFQPLDKEKQIETLYKTLVVKDSTLFPSWDNAIPANIQKESQTCSKDFFLYWKKVGYAKLKLNKDFANLLYLASSNFLLHYPEEGEKMSFLNLHSADIPYLGHAMLQHILVFIKNFKIDVLFLHSTPFAIKKWFYDLAFNYFKKRKIIQNFESKYSNYVIYLNSHKDLWKE